MRWLATFNNLETRNAWVASVARRLPSGARVLDAGAGECPYRELFAHCDYRTHDFCRYEGYYRRAELEPWEYGRIDYESDITAIPVGDGEFDAVLCTEVLEHVPRPIRALEELARILAPGGWLYISAPLGSGLHQEPYHYYGGFTPHFYRYFLHQLGFEEPSISPNGGFFRLYSESTSRVRNILIGSRRYGRLHPCYWLVKVGLRWLMHWFVKLDDQELVEQFTVGYHVEARKKPARAGSGE